MYRPALVTRALAGPVTLIGAPGGYGKSTLAAQLLRSIGAAAATVVVPAEADVTTVVAEAGRALRRTGLTDLAAAATDPASALDALVEAMCAPDGALSLVFDEVQRAGESAVDWLAALGREVRGPGHLVLVGRRIPVELERITAAAGLGRIGPDELRFGPAEIAVLAQVEPGDEAVARLLALTDGWPAAVALAVRRGLGVAGSEQVASGGVTGVLSRLLDEVVGPPGSPLRNRLAPLAHLPLLSGPLCSAVAGAGAFELLVESGVDLRADGRGWFTIADPVREALAVEERLEESLARRAAAAYAEAGELSVGIALLHQLGDLDGMAELLACRPWGELGVLTTGELKVLVMVLGDTRLARWPEALRHAIWAIDTRDDDLRRSLVDRFVALAAASDDPVMQRAAAAEAAIELPRQGDAAGCLAQVARALDGIGPDELVTRARALYAAGHANTLLCTSASMAEADTQMEEATAIFTLLGERRWVADSLTRHGYNVSFQSGRIAVAFDQLSAALALTPAPDRVRARVLSYYTDVADSAGRIAEAQAGADECYEIALRIGDKPLLCLACWAQATIAAHLGDRAATARWIDTATRHGGRWLDGPHGLEFALACSEMFAQLGAEAPARQWWTTSQAQAATLDVMDVLPPAQLRLEATFGDPARAQAIWEALQEAPFATPRERWLRNLLAALAAARQGQLDLARTHYDSACAEARLLGFADLPRRHEGQVVQRLVEAGVVDASSSGSAAVRVALLGHFSVTAGAQDLTPPPGHAAELVQLLAVHEVVPAEQVIDQLWPDADPAKGPPRLRNLLNRLRSSSGPIVVRDGTVLRLADEVEVDAALFERLAAAALAAPADQRSGLARQALSLYSGDLLASDPYLEWVGPARERLRRRYLAVVDVLIAAATAAGDLDEALRLADLAIAAEPFDEARYLAAARLLVTQGRRVAAAELMERLARSLDDVGTEPSAAATRLLAAVRDPSVPMPLA